MASSFAGGLSNVTDPNADSDVLESTASGEHILKESYSRETDHSQPGVTRTVESTSIVTEDDPDEFSENLGGRTVAYSGLDDSTYQHPSYRANKSNFKQKEREYLENTAYEEGRNVTVPRLARPQYRYFQRNASAPEGRYANISDVTQGRPISPFAIWEDTNPRADYSSRNATNFRQRDDLANSMFDRDRFATLPRTARPTPGNFQSLPQKIEFSEADQTVYPIHYAPRQLLLDSTYQRSTSGVGDNTSYPFNSSYENMTYDPTPFHPFSTWINPESSAIDTSGAPNESTFLRGIPGTTSTPTGRGANATFSRPYKIPFAKPRANATSGRRAGNVTYPRPGTDATFVNPGANATFARPRQDTTTVVRPRTNATFQRQRADATFARRRADATFPQRRPEGTFVKPRAEGTFVRSGPDRTFARPPTSDATYPRPRNLEFSLAPPARAYEDTYDVTQYHPYSTWINPQSSVLDSTLVGSPRRIRKVTQEVVTETPPSINVSDTLDESGFQRGVQQEAVASSPRKQEGRTRDLMIYNSDAGGIVSARLGIGDQTADISGDVQRALLSLEQNERTQINRDLLVFQGARRKFMDTSAFVSSSQKPTIHFNRSV